jgi:hypothetical protein
MRAKPSVMFWMGSSFCAAFALASIVLAVLGAGERGTDAALAATGRLSFLLFWLAYAGGALVALFGSTFQPIKQRTRAFGLSFASAHLVHLGLVAWLCHIGATPAMPTFVFFGIAVWWTYLLALFSIPALHKGLHPALWWLLRVVGLNYIAYAFAKDFLANPLHGGLKHIVMYLPFAVLSVAGPLLCLTAWILRTANTGRGPSYFAR